MEEGSPEKGWAVRGEGCIPSGSVRQDRACRGRPQCWEREAGPGLAPFPCLQVVRLGGRARREWLGGRVSGSLAATEEAHWKVLDMSGPLGSQLEELDVTPLNSIDGHSQHGLLLLCRADEAADALDDLALRIHLLFPGLLAQEDSGHFLVLLFGDNSHCHGARKLGFPCMWQARNLHRAEDTLKSIL